MHCSNLCSDLLSFFICCPAALNNERKALKPVISMIIMQILRHYPVINNQLIFN